MKFCIYVGLEKVKVGLVCREMKTLLELILAEPTCESADDPEGEGGGEGEGVGGGAGAVDLQTDGCPEQVNPL